MMKRLDASAFEVLPPKAGGWDLDLLARDCLVDLHAVGTHEVFLTGIDFQGELKTLDRGTVIQLKAHVTGFRALNVRSDGPISLRAFMSDGAEVVDPTRMVVTEAVTVDPVRAAMGEELRRILARQEAERRLSDQEIEELVDDFVNPELEFEEGLDDWGLPAAAAELEEEAAQAREKAQEEFYRRRDAEAVAGEAAVPGAAPGPGEPLKPQAPVVEVGRPSVPGAGDPV